MPPPTRPAADAPTVARLRPQSPHRPAPPPSPPPSSTLRSLSRAPQGHPPPSDMDIGPVPPRTRGTTASLRLHRGTEKADRARDGDHQTGGRDGIGRDTAGVGCGTGPKQGPAGTQPRPCKPAHGATGAPRMARRRPTSDSEAGEMPERPEAASAAFCAVLLNRRRETTPGLPRSRPPCPACYYVDMVP